MKTSKTTIAAAVALFVSGNASAEFGFMNLNPGSGDTSTPFTIDLQRTNSRDINDSFTSVRTAFTASDELVFVAELSNGDSYNFAGAGIYYDVFSNTALDLSLYAWYRQSEKIFESSFGDASLSVASAGLQVSGNESVIFDGLNWYGSMGIGRVDGIFTFDQDSDREKLASTYSVEAGLSKSLFTGEMYGGVEYSNLDLDLGSFQDSQGETSVGIGYRFNVN